MYDTVTQEKWAVTPIFLSDFENPYQDFFQNTYEPQQNISVLASTAIKRPDFLRPSRDAHRAYVQWQIKKRHHFCFISS